MEAQLIFKSSKDDNIMQFYMISVSFFHVFIAGIIEENAPGGGVLARFYRPGGWGFELFFARGVGNSPIKRIARGMVRLVID